MFTGGKALTAVNPRVILDSSVRGPAQLERVVCPLTQQPARGESLTFDIRVAVLLVSSPQGTSPASVVVEEEGVSPSPSSDLAGNLLIPHGCLESKASCIILNRESRPCPSQ